MKLVHSISLALAITSCGSLAWSAQPFQQDAHHPAASSSTSKVMPGKASSDMSAMNTQMKAMGEVHDKMMAAKTPEERDALMAQHMKIMQDSMAMMKGMSAGAMGDMKGTQKSEMATHNQVMEKRMDMMQSMMQMMMDRMPVPAGR
ncbi:MULTISPECIES: hypothetical protein [Polaromonas]|uniref:Uncharacterized protein n=1 Tax=Polaromonas aquatica TaxID=332657 RepID=A0ABW1U0D3_9BURK